MCVCITVWSWRLKVASYFVNLKNARPTAVKKHSPHKNAQSVAASDESCDRAVSWFTGESFCVSYSISWMPVYQVVASLLSGPILSFYYRLLPVVDVLSRILSVLTSSSDAGC